MTPKDLPGQEKPKHHFSQEAKSHIYLMDSGAWSSEGTSLFSRHESDCYKVKSDSVLMSQEVNTICWPDGLAVALPAAPARGFEIFALVCI